MASTRRTKNFATDPQTPMFLYTILKQLDLRSINWNDVAGSLGISNGHAARMRYSRMKSQFEGTSNQVKPPKPKKDNSNTTDNKSSKTKAKNKRLLEEEENERLADQRAASQQVMQPELDSKRFKVEPHSYAHSWYPLYTADAVQTFPSAFWGQPAIPLQPAPQASHGPVGVPARNVDPTPLIKTEPNMTLPPHHDDVETATTTIKQEREDPVRHCGGAEVSTTVVKKEPGTLVEDEALPTTSRNSVSFAYPLSRTINAFFGPQQSAPTAAQSHSFPADTSAFSTSQTLPRGVYSFSGHGYGQTPFPWPTQCPGPNPGTLSTDDACDQMILNPYAASYQDMLNMPLYRLYPETSSLQTLPGKTQRIAPESGLVDIPNVELHSEENNGRLPPALSTTTSPPPPESVTVKHSGGVSSTRTSVTVSDSHVSSSGSAVPADISVQPAAIPDVIEVDSDDEGEVQTSSTTAARDVSEPKIKKEVAGL
ncbi:hypothetical protein AYO21_01180 [Fonsecaea monophora]|uniref:Myb-like DNA-binding domain-containing protein n=1 Tax=Fonsecaea monophora TaxID=254056 RepID=A0A177FM88_9EURO|nr:hypothetical protein AYO21_01180 [Fonsecaea monophora]KAH0841585.1 hypothetical protein FOPE_06869 [Fonsecaea pedrosoi]OAG44690.1 hypothetical protein AYO21_01180 [Fonsecaea monophora]